MFNFYSASQATFTALITAFYIFQPLSSLASNIEFAGKAMGNKTGEIEITVRLTNPSYLPVKAIPKTERSASYDNGQFESASCVTSATFESVAILDIEATLSQDHQFAFASGTLNASISNSYSIDESELLCNTSSLTEVRSTTLFGQILGSSLPIDYQGKDALLEINLFEMSHKSLVTVSGNEKLMSFDGLIFENYRQNGIRAYYQIVRRTAGSVSTLEAGWLNLKAR